MSACLLSVEQRRPIKAPRPLTGRVSGGIDHSPGVRSAGGIVFHRQVCSNLLSDVLRDLSL